MDKVSEWMYAERCTKCQYINERLSSPCPNCGDKLIMLDDTEKLVVRKAFKGKWFKPWSQEYEWEIKEVIQY